MIRFGSWDWLPEDGRVTWSPELFKIFGEDPGSFEPTFEAYLDHVHPEERDDVAERIRSAVEACEPFLFEHRIIGGEGEVRTVGIQGQAVEISDGRAVRVVGTCQDVTERRLEEVRLQYLADHDSLTGLVNGRRFSAELEQQISFNDRYGGQGAVMIIDVDHFKRVNDSLGHHAGDNLIRHIAALLAERVRTTDTVARLAGDEFAVLAPQVTREGARALAEDITAFSATGRVTKPVRGRSPRASGSRCSAATRTPRRRWWPPTRRCTTPRRRGATGSPSSLRSMARSRGASAARRARRGSARRFKTTSSRSTSSRSSICARAGLPGASCCCGWREATGSRSPPASSSRPRSRRG